MRNNGKSFKKILNCIYKTSVFRWADILTLKHVRALPLGCPSYHLAPYKLFKTHYGQTPLCSKFYWVKLFTLMT